MTVINSIARRMKQWNPAAKIAYLAYFDHVQPPVLQPEDNVFLEYAPFEKYVATGPDARERIRQEWAAQEQLVEIFGQEDLKVLEYWFDNSMFSGWTKPPKFFALDRQAMEQDVAHYKNWGVKQLASFACYLGQDYEALYDPVDITPFTEAVRK